VVRQRQAGRSRDDLAALGVQELRALHAFPLTICAPGYSRLTRELPDCVVVPFWLPNDQRIPLYVLL
jgi:hypothetical protein